MCDPKKYDQPQAVNDDALDQAVGGLLSSALPTASEIPANSSTQSAMQKQQESTQAKSSQTAANHALLTTIIGNVK